MSAQDSSINDLPGSNANAISARIPKHFAWFLRVLFYGTIAMQMALIALGGPRYTITILPALILLGFCLWLFGHWIRLYNRKRASYEITETGVVDRMSFPSGAEVPWESIESVALYNWLGFAGVKFRMKPRSTTFSRRVPFLDQFVGGINAMSYGSPLVLWQFGSDRPLAELLETARRTLQSRRIGEIPSPEIETIDPRWRETNQNESQQISTGE